MGHSIVYCDKCGLLLKEEDFRQGKAFTADNRSYCAACRPTGSSPSIPQPGSKISSTRIPKQPGRESVTSTRIPRQPHIESRRLQALPPAPPVPPPAPEASNSKMIWIGAGVAAIVICGLAAMFSGGKPPPKPPEDGIPTTRIVVSVPQPPV